MFLRARLRWAAERGRGWRTGLARATVSLVVAIARPPTARSGTAAGQSGSDRSPFANRPADPCSCPSATRRRSCPGTSRARPRSASRPVLGVLVLERVQERLELRDEVQVGRVERVVRRRHVVRVVRHVHEGVRVGGHVLHQQPRLGLVRRTPRDSDHGASGNARAVGRGVVRRGRQWRGVVVEVGGVETDEVRPGAPLTVHRDRHPADLEVVLRGELVGGAGDEPLQLVGPGLEVTTAVDLGDELLLPVEHLCPARVRGERRVALVVEPGRAEHVPEAERRVAAAVVAEPRHEPGDLDRAVGVELRELLRVRHQFVGGLRRVGDPGRLEHVEVVVHPRHVGEERQRALVPVIARVRQCRRRERRRHVDAVRPVDVRGHVDPRTRAAPQADVVDAERQDRVRRLAGVDRRRDLVVGEPGAAVDRDPRVLLLEAVEDLVEDLRLGCGGPLAPHRQGHRSMGFARVDRLCSGAVAPRAQATAISAITVRTGAHRFIVASSSGRGPASSSTSRRT